MSTVATRLTATPQPLLSHVARVAVAVAVAGFVALSWVSAGRASHQAVDTTTAALSVTRVTLPSVEIVARREPAAVAAVAASGNYAPRGPRNSAL